MKKITNKESILIKSEILIDVKNKLKTEFVGLDDIIDELVDLIEPWFIFPNNQSRPTIINLFGMTGIGKTSLITRLFKLINIESVIRFDVGEWVDSQEQLSYTISNQIRKTKLDNNRPVFIFDEFQLGRTLDDDGSEIDRPNLRVVWELFDSGKFTIHENNWQANSIQTIYNKLYYLIEHKGLKSRYGKIVSGLKDWTLYFEQEIVENVDIDDIEKKELNDIIENYVKDPIISAHDIYTLFDILEKSSSTSTSTSKSSYSFFSEKELTKYLLTLQTEKDTLRFIEELLIMSTTPIVYDFSDSIIFIIGNLDAAYVMSDDMDADMDADYLYEQSKKITINNIKQALSKLYRPEQISRLGYNYLIYRSFNKNGFNELIDLELNKLIEKVEEKFEFTINFTDSTKELIYKEGVFASQGIRPILSTIFNLIETKITKIVIDIIKDDIEVKNIKWDVDKNKTKFIININDSDTIYEYDLKLKVDNLRNSVGDDTQALVGIHESGHVITSCYDLEICPKIAVSKTLIEGGYTKTDIPSLETKDYLYKNLIVLLGGYAAEKLVFGEDNLSSGTYFDLKYATNIVLSMIKEYGMNGIPLQYASSDFRVSHHSLNDEGLDNIAEEIVKSALIKTEKRLKDNMVLLLKMGEYLTINSKIEEKKIKSMVKKYGVDPLPIYKTKENYYDYKKILKNKIKNIKNNK